MNDSGYDFSTSGAFSREALRHIYPSDISSVESQSSRDARRPLSYRDMRRLDSKFSDNSKLVT